MITSWSASRIFQYEECAAKLRYRVIDRLPEEPGPPLVRGKAIHAEGETYLKVPHDGQRLEVPTSYRYLKTELRTLRRDKAVSEEQWGFTADWQLTDWRTATIRMVLDAHWRRRGSVHVVDFKTGKPRQKDEDQVGLYAVGAFARFKGLRRVVGQLWYLDLGSIVELKFNALEVADERRYWERRAKRMMDDTTLEPTPGYFCKWCSFGKSKGGPCKEEQR